MGVIVFAQPLGAKMLLNYRNDLVAAGKRPGTVQQRLLHISHLKHHHPDLLRVVPQDLVNHLARKSASNGPEGLKAIRASLRSFYRWALKCGLVPVDPSVNLEPIHVPRTVARIAADGDVQTALITADTSRRAMILLARFGCLRLNELTTLHTRDRQADILRVVGKGGKHRLVPANPELLHTLLQLEQEQGSGYYFPGRYGGTMHPCSVGKVITRMTGWNPHSLRHAGATAAYEATKDLRAVQELLGHASLATTQRYLHTSMDKVRAAAAGTAFVDRYRSPHFPAIAA